MRLGQTTIRHRLPWLLLALALVTLGAACASGGSDGAPASTAASENAPATTATTAAETGSTAPATTSAESTSEAETSGDSGSVASPEASCAEDLKPGSVQAIACGWIARADPAVCARMSDRLLGELFGASGSQARSRCESVIGDLPAPDDPGLVTFTPPEREGKGTTLVLADGSQDIVYAFRFSRSGGRWTIDEVQQLSNAGAGGEGSEEAETVTPNSPGDDGEIAALVTRWYADVDPGVCDSMTNKMLEFGWSARGTEGRDLCEQSLDGAEPVGDVVVRKPSVEGDTATVEVVYTLDGDRQIDEIDLVRRNGAWLVDAVRLSGFAP